MNAPQELTVHSQGRKPVLWAWTNTCLKPNCLAEGPGHLLPNQLAPAVRTFLWVLEVHWFEVKRLLGVS